MVKNSGKTLRSGAYKPVNTPIQTAVKEDETGFPIKVALPHWQIVAEIEDSWRIDDEWWRSEPISRLYYNIRLGSGQRLMLYRDLISSNWYQQLY
jgi:hypothetical protein